MHKKLLQLLQHYNPHHFMERYTAHFYENAECDMIRNYAVIYDKDNIDKYPVSTPLPRMEDLWEPYMPSYFTYGTLKKLAAHCEKWRQK